MLIREGGTVLDVAIGTGFPFGDYFYKAGYDVHGIDISPQLLEKCKKYYPSINCKLGDAHSLPYADETFDCTYSLHSSWYFYDIHKAIDEMIRVTRTGGFIIIDVMNKYNWLVKRGYNKRVFENQKILGRVLKTVKNILKIILRKGIPEWQYVVHFNPTDPEEIYKHLNSKQISQVQIMVSDLKELLSLKNFPL